MNIGTIIKSLRIERGYTQPQLAKLIGVSNAVISFWENNLREPTASNIILLAKYLDVSTDYLLGNEND